MGTQLWFRTGEAAAGSSPLAAAFLRVAADRACGLVLIFTCALITLHSNRSGHVHNRGRVGEGKSCE